MKWANIVMAGGVVAGACLSPMALAASYTLKDLGDLADGANASGALSINSAGVVVGYGNDASGQHAVEWAGSTLSDLVSAYTSSALHISDSGTVVGTYITSSGTTHGYVLSSSGSFTDVGDLKGGADYSVANSVNSSGVVVGYSSGYVNGASGTYTYRAYTYSNGTMTQLGSLNDASSTYTSRASYANDINDSGTVVGYSNYANTFHATRWQNGVTTDLGVLSGTTTSRAYAVNASGTIVGSSGNYAAIWVGGTISKIASFADATGAAVAYDINDAGIVVGQVKVNGGYDGFYWTSSGGMISLDSLLGAAYADWNVTDARSINNDGTIAATATDAEGVSHAITLTLAAVPEADSWSMMLAGLLGIGFLARRTRSVSR